MKPNCQLTKRHPFFSAFQNAYCIHNVFGSFQIAADLLAFRYVNSWACVNKSWLPFKTTLFWPAQQRLQRDPWTIHCGDGGGAKFFCDLRKAAVDRLCVLIATDAAAVAAAAIGRSCRLPGTTPRKKKYRRCDSKERQAFAFRHVDLTKKNKERNKEVTNKRTKKERKKKKKKKHKHKH